MAKKKVVCPTCKGKGIVKDKQKSGVFSTKEKSCENCNGTGYVYEK